MEKVILPSIIQIKTQLLDFQKAYPNISIIKETEEEIRLKGDFLLHKECCDYQILENYEIEIVIPLGVQQFPYVIDVNGYIDPSYRHYYPKTKILCLETDVRFMVDFVGGFDLLFWMRNYVEAYFFTYEYYMRFDEFPYGERQHGLVGVLEAYQEILDVKSTQEAYDFMHYISTNPYRGHLCCPCNSGKKIRICHGDKMLRFYNSQQLNKLIKKDFEKITEALRISDANKDKTKRRYGS